MYGTGRWRLLLSLMGSFAFVGPAGSAVAASTGTAKPAGAKTYLTGHPVKFSAATDA
jgi:hypothetical protein